MGTQQDLIQRFDEKIKCGNDMVDQLKLVKIEGVDKLIRKIYQEVRFLIKVRSAGNAKKEHLQSTNLIHLNAIVERLMSTNEPVGVLKPFNHQNSRLEIDIVCDGGSSWIKVIARNAKALTLISQGRAEYGQKSVIDQANFYFTCAKNHPHMYKPPTIVFHFACGIEKPLANKLKNLGVIIEGKEIDAQGDDSGEITDNEMSLSESETTSRDSITNNVSTLLGYVTNMTNGRVNYKYLETLLTRQAECERCRPLKHILDSLFQDKKLLVCQTAYDNFKSIVNLIGGPNEKNRTDELISRVTIVNDVPQGRVMQLCLGGKIKMRSRLIFASGENNKCITVSANEGFVRAARMQGVECVVFIHEPRSLSELKELNAERIES